MKYVIPLMVSLPIFTLPFIGNKSITWEAVFLMLGCFWVGIAIGEELK